MNLTQKEKKLLSIRKSFTDRDQGKIDFKIEDLVLKQLIKNNKKNLCIQLKNKLNDDEVIFLQAYRLLDNQYKNILLKEIEDINLQNAYTQILTKLLVVK